MDAMVEAVDLRYLLLEHYKQLGFQEKHVMVILMMDQLTKQDNRLVTAELLSLKMAMPLEEIDQVMVDLLQRQLIEFVTIDGKTQTSLKPVKQLLYKRFQQQVIHQTQEVNMTEQTSLFQIIEKSLARTLSPLEISRIQDWLNFGYTPEQIQSALDEAIKKQTKSIRYMDKILQKMATKENFAQEGVGLLNKDHRRIYDTLADISKKLDDDPDHKK
jgi:DnaD/phage-associated family protein